MARQIDCAYHAAVRCDGLQLHPIAGLAQCVPFTIKTWFWIGTGAFIRSAGVEITCGYILAAGNFERVAYAITIGVFQAVASAVHEGGSWVGTRSIFIGSVGIEVASRFIRAAWIRVGVFAEDGKMAAQVVRLRTIREDLDIEIP